MSDLIEQAVALTWARQRISDALTAVRARIIEEIGPGGRQYARTSDGREAGTVSVTRPTPARTVTEAIVDDWDALTRWLAEEQPEAVRMRVADWWLADLDGWIERHGGELPPGVTMAEYEDQGIAPRVSVRISDAQRAVIEECVSGGARALVDAVAQIEAGEQA